MTQADPNDPFKGLVTSSELKARKKAQQLHPRKTRPKPDRSGRPWGVDYHLVYDHGGTDQWIQYYHTKLGARISAFLHYHIRSWGGRATLFDNRKEQYYG